ncbi:hypothetical protein CGRA01v4_00189 [Colletotrichum graminicola]|uniref:Uncharacterized protein n=1 Tax=Colletotrichum graminicola (strain M1.001 / M2 / FGSC 10212) TaxID=645133 RepID=E3QYB0_COLGM|nr:uncharacterized protein GLRG_10957 [Colletotrichum graminicola M1.001]EFQ35848.1 hypothetical protein GLRG_10957 [Colletotrichum graminicola M1.001]WDK08911.1 hypothetical protein CGRA01v4_00189 [Colletotrichum graminicola]
MGSGCSCFFPSSFPLSYSFVSPQKIATKDMMGRLDFRLETRGAAQQCFFCYFLLALLLSRDRQKRGGVGKREGLMTKRLAREKKKKRKKSNPPFICLKKRSVIFSGILDGSKGYISRGWACPSETPSHEPNLARCRWLFHVWRGGGRS